MKKISVIIADDHAVVRSGIRQFLEGSDEIEVIAEAENGEIALSILLEKTPDVAILDIHMPKLSGIDVIKSLRENNYEQGILVLTAYDEEPYVNAVLKAGANGFVLKTSSPEAIIKAVKDVFDGKSVLDPSVIQYVINKITKSDDGSIYEALTSRENEVLILVSKGLTNKAIAVQLKISDRTVQGHIAHIFNKLQASSRTEAVMKAISLGWMIVDGKKIV